MLLRGRRVVFVCALVLVAAGGLAIEACGSSSSSGSAAIGDGGVVDAGADSASPLVGNDAESDIDSGVQGTVCRFTIGSETFDLAINDSACDSVGHGYWCLPDGGYTTVAGCVADDASANGYNILPCPGAANGTANDAFTTCDPRAQACVTDDAGASCTTLPTGCRDCDCLFGDGGNTVTGSSYCGTAMAGQYGCFSFEGVVTIDCNE